MEKPRRPFIGLGSALEKIRTRLKESVAEVSGAVEIDAEKLLQYELGAKRPSEDILELLIAHFAVQDEEANRLWKLAGYDDPKLVTENDDPQLTQQSMMLLPFDARVIYTDSMNVIVNNNGVVINFMQNAGAGQQLPAARVGMSLEQAKRVADTLQATIKTAIERNNPKRLPSSSENTDQEKRS